MSNCAKVMRSVPTISSRPPVSWERMGMAIGRVTPCRVSRPRAIAARPSAAGRVSTKVARGKASDSRPSLRMRLSRRGSSLVSSRRSAPMRPRTAWPSRTVTRPEIARVRPTAVVAPMPASVSRTR